MHELILQAALRAQARRHAHELRNQAFADAVAYLIAGLKRLIGEHARAGSQPCHS